MDTLFLDGPLLLVGRPPLALSAIATAGLVGAVAWAYRPSLVRLGTAMSHVRREPA